MKLMIIESPGKIEKLSGILGADWKIAASVGHVRDLPLKEIGVEAPEFRPHYELTERGSGVVAKLAKLVREADSVYLATDPDREGESISWHLQQCLMLKNPLRVAFNEITPTAVKSALLNPRTIDVNKVAAQEARRVLDRLVGYMVSPELSKQTGERMSAGRVQSPAVRLVVERERQICAFKQTLHFGARLSFADAKTSWNAEWLTRHEGSDWSEGLGDFVTDDQPYFLDKGFAEQVAQVQSVRVAAFEQGEESRSPPAPFTTSTLQQAASVSLGLDPKNTMEAAQKLYEQGHITYHRTDNPNVSDESLADIYAVAVKLGLDMADEPRKFKAPAGAQVGHPAVTPTHWEIEEAGETDAQRSLYKLIRLRAIACQLADAVYAVREVALISVEPVSSQLVAFKAKGRKLIYRGWLKLLEGDQTEEPESETSVEPANPVPELTPGEVLTVSSGSLLEKKTRPPARYTQATLVRKLESENIGRPATYAAIMENILTRGYVVTEKKKFLAPTELGALICDSLVGRFQFIDLGFTRDLEGDLDRIANGQMAFKVVVSRVHEQLQTELEALQASALPAKYPCPTCSKALRRIKGQSGYFWGCSGHPLCSVSLPDADGKPGKREAPKHSEYKCLKCDKPLSHRVKKGKGGYDFFGCTGFKEGCKETYPSKGGKPDYHKVRK